MSKPRVHWVNATINATGNFLGYSTAAARLGEALAAEFDFDDAAPVALTIAPPALFLPVEGKINALVTMTESRVLHDNHGLREAMRRGLNQADALIVPSKWCAEVFREHTRTPVHVAPLGVDTHTFHPNGRRAFSPRDERPFRWLYLGAPNARKFGGAVFGQLYVNLLADLPCEVYFKTTGGDWIEELATKHGVEQVEPRLWKVGRLTVDARMLPLAELVGIYNAADGALCLHCGEGFGLGALEAQACGLPVVVTDYSGTTEFCTTGNSFPVKPSGQEEFGFVIPDLADAARQITNVMCDPAGAHRIGKQAARDAKRFTWGASARKIRGILSEIAEGRIAA